MVELDPKGMEAAVEAIEGPFLDAEHFEAAMDDWKDLMPQAIAAYFSAAGTPVVLTEEEIRDLYELVLAFENQTAVSALKAKLRAALASSGGERSR